MTELWVPQMKEIPDAGNIFDMMLLFQDQLEFLAFEGGNKEHWFVPATMAIKSLSRTLKNMPSEKCQVEIAADLLWIQSTDEAKQPVPFEEVGVIGSFIDVHAVSIGNAAPMISMALDVESIYPLGNPDDHRPLIAPGIAPITRVQYVKQEQAA